MELGARVPDFTLPDQYGEQTSLSSLLATGPVVLFFYPAAMTKGCTMESCHFRDLAQEFTDLGAHRVGISMDSVDKQRRFSDTYDFDYPPPRRSRRHRGQDLRGEAGRQLVEGQAIDLHH